MANDDTPYPSLRKELDSCNRVPGLLVSVKNPEGPGRCTRTGDTSTGTVALQVRNETNEDYTLCSYKLSIEDNSVTSSLSDTLPFGVAKGSVKEIEVTISGTYDVFDNRLVFDFGGDVKCSCHIRLVVVSDILQLIAPNGKFEPKKRKFDYLSRQSNTVEGEKPPSSGDASADLIGKPSGVPQNIRRRPKKSCLPALTQPLTMENYSDHFHKLLWLEELGREGDVRQYDMFSVTLTAGVSYLYLNVPGLDKRKDPVMKGDKLIFSQPEVPSLEAVLNSEGGTEQEATPTQQEAAPSFARRYNNYIAYVHEIIGEQLKLKFHHSFHNSRELWSRKYDVMFTVNRGPLRRMHQALDSTEKVGAATLFPRTRLSPPISLAHVPFDFINKKLNARQKCAVEAIVSAACRPIPYILFGPPGTGKTVTVVESIIQVYLRHPSCKILACAPSNSAADLLAERLHSSGRIEAGSMRRLNAYMRTQEVPDSIKDFCVVANKSAKAKARDSRIVICTCSTAHILKTFNLKYSHVFVDEAGQALEPECLIPASLLVEGSGQLVLAGDPLQLGPVTFSSLASDNGLSVSMLERLMEKVELYKRDPIRYAAIGNYDSMMVTKLVENYRSHGTLLQLYSEQFYDGELVERADRQVTHQLCNWAHLPTRGIPLLFHGIQGSESREHGSPSWFNPLEAQQVLIYAKNLVQQCSVEEKDIGIITPYSKQVEKIRLVLDNQGLRNVKVGSVEEFQGRENLVIIISTVRSSDDLFIEDMRKQVGFVSNPKRFNVAISRAQALLIVVGNPHLLAQADSNVQRTGVFSPVKSCWGSLIQFAKDKGCYTGCPLPTKTT